MNWGASVPVTLEAPFALLTNTPTNRVMVVPLGGEVFICVADACVVGTEITEAAAAPSRAADWLAELVVESW